MEIWNLLVHIMNQTLEFFYSITHSWGIAIILLTCLVKILILPLTKKQFQAMKDLQNLQPEMKKIQEKFKKDPKEMQKRMMLLYKEHKVNPLGGCLPLIVQMPILILLYRTIMSIKTKFVSATFLWAEPINCKTASFLDTSFLWIPSLLSPDLILLALYALSMYVSQKLTTPPTLDRAQQESQKMMTIMMPILFTFMFRTFPSAFILYWLVFNILSTGHQYLIMGSLSPITIKSEETEGKKDEKKK